MFVAFSFGAFIEGAAGFGAPVAISGAMLAGLGFSPFYAAGICLLGNTTPVAFGSLGIPVTTLANVTGLPLLSLSAMIGRLCAMVSLFIPGYLIVVMSGPKRALEVLPAIIACGVSFAGVQFYVSNYWGPELTDIASSLTCIGVMVLVLKIWKPAHIFVSRETCQSPPPSVAIPRASCSPRGSPYMMLVVSVLVFGAPSIKAAMNRWTDSLLARVSSEERDGSEWPARPGTSQCDYADSTGDGEAVAIRGRLRGQLAQRSGHRLPHGGHPDGADSASAPRGNSRKHTKRPSSNWRCRW